MRLQRWAAVFVAALPLLLGGCAEAKLPEDISTHGGPIDHLFWMIMWLTGVTFVATEAVLVWAVLRYRHRPGAAAQHTHGHHLVEMVWTIVPGIILFFLAVYQISAWDAAKINLPEEKDSLVVRVLAKQYEWSFQYAGPDGQFDTDDDAYSLGTLEGGGLVIPEKKPILLKMRSIDVLHSLFLPHLRFKQDLLPGMEVQGWFEAKSTTARARARRSKEPDWRKFNFEIACAELCGLGHGRMRSIITILKQDEFDAWVTKQSANYHRKTGGATAPDVFNDGAWVKALSYGDPDKMFRQAGPGEPGFKPRKEEHK